MTILANDIYYLNVSVFEEGCSHIATHPVENAAVELAADAFNDSMETMFRPENYSENDLKTALNEIIHEGSVDVVNALDIVQTASSEGMLDDALLDINSLSDELICSRRIKDVDEMKTRSKMRSPSSETSGVTLASVDEYPSIQLKQNDNSQSFKLGLALKDTDLGEELISESDDVMEDASSSIHCSREVLDTTIEDVYTGTLEYRAEEDEYSVTSLIGPNACGGESSNVDETDDRQDERDTAAEQIKDRQQEREVNDNITEHVTREMMDPHNSDDIEMKEDVTDILKGKDECDKVNLIEDTAHMRLDTYDSDKETTRNAFDLLATEDNSVAAEDEQDDVEGDHKIEQKACSPDDNVADERDLEYEGLPECADANDPISTELHSKGRDSIEDYQSSELGSNCEKNAEPVETSKPDGQGDKKDPCMLS